MRGRPRGSWLSSQYRWTTAEQWIGGLPPIDAEIVKGEHALADPDLYRRGEIRQGAASVLHAPRSTVPVRTPRRSNPSCTDIPAL